MRRRAFSIVPVVIACLWLGTVGAGAQTKYGKLIGRVINAINNEPVRGITVEVVGYGETKTDENGVYRFDKLPVGSYTVGVKSSEFSEPQSRVTIHANQTRPLNFSVTPLRAPRQQPENQSRAIKQTNVNPSDVANLLAGSVKGQLTYLRVRPYSVNNVSKSSWMVKVGESSATPDEQGNYNIAGLAPGTYTVALEGGNRCYAPDPRNKKSVKIRAGQTVTLNLHVFVRC